jgi:hypothetical protein
MQRLSLPWLLLAISVVLYVACLRSAAFCLWTGDCLSGWWVLVYGWLGLRIGEEPSRFIWLANPMLLVTWALVAIAHLVRRQSAAIWAARCALITLLVAVAFMVHPWVKNPYSTGGGAERIASYGAGYWLWLASMVCAFLSAIIAETVDPRPSRAS